MSGDLPDRGAGLGLGHQGVGAEGQGYAGGNRAKAEGLAATTREKPPHQRRAGEGLDATDEKPVPAPRPPGHRPPEPDRKAGPAEGLGAGPGGVKVPTSQQDRAATRNGGQGPGTKDLETVGLAPGVTGPEVAGRGNPHDPPRFHSHPHRKSKTRQPPVDHHPQSLY